MRKKSLIFFPHWTSKTSTQLQWKMKNKEYKMHNCVYICTILILFALSLFVSLSLSLPLALTGTCSCCHFIPFILSYALCFVLLFTAIKWKHTQSKHTHTQSKAERRKSVCVCVCVQMHRTNSVETIDIITVVEITVHFSQSVHFVLLASKSKHRRKR